MAIRPNHRLGLAGVVILVLCAAVTTPVGSSSANYTTGGKSTVVTGGSTGWSPNGKKLGGSPALSSGGTADSTRGAIGGVSASSHWNVGGAPELASSTSPGSTGNSAAGGPPSTHVAPPAGVDAGPARPTWRESEVVLTVDPSYSALPYAQEALEAALLAWTSVANQLPKVTLRYVNDTLESQTSDENLGDHRIFFAPYSDKRAKGALAITLVTADEAKNAILDADILVNGGHLFTDVTRGIGGKVQANSYDLQDVITHELGHWFGLDEEYVNAEATMYAYVYPGETKKRDLDQSDITAVQLAYWQADNPSENVGCGLARSKPGKRASGFGCLAAALCLLWRRNRPAGAHVLKQARRLRP